MSGRKPAVLRVRKLLQEIPVASLPVHLRPTMLLLATYADSDGSNIYPSAATLGSALGRARSTISDHLQKLDRLDVVKPTGARKTWNPTTHTAIRYIDFRTLNRLASDGLGHHATNDETARQTIAARDGEEERLTVEAPSNDGPGRNNLPNLPIDQTGDSGDDVETSPPSPRVDPETIASMRGHRSWQEFLEETTEASAMPGVDARQRQTRD